MDLQFIENLFEYCDAEFYFIKISGMPLWLRIRLEQAVAKITSRVKIIEFISNSKYFYYSIFKALSFK